MSSWIFGKKIKFIHQTSFETHDITELRSKYEEIKGLKPEEFRRLTGVKPKTFQKMLEILVDADRIKKARGDLKNISIKDMLLMTLDICTSTEYISTSQKAMEVLNLAFIRT
jgi:uncharacterized Fe-S cluster-containing radical SAM superfamily protein